MPKPIDAVVADLTRETDWSSLAVDVALRQVRLVEIDGARPGTTVGNRESYLTTASGQRKYAQFSRVEGRDVCVLLGYADGERCASVQFRPAPDQDRPKAVVIGKTFLREAKTGTAEVPAALPFFVGLEPLRDAIRRATPVGPGRALDRACDRYYFAGVRDGDATQDLVFSLDASTSFPLRVEAFADRPSFDAGRPLTAWEATRLDEVQGRHVAVDSRLSTYGVGPNRRWEPTLVNEYHVTNVRFDAAIPASEFWPRLEPGMLVYDRVAQKAYKVGADGQPATAQPAPARSSAPTWAFSATLAVGLALVIVGIARRHRARPVA